MVDGARLWRRVLAVVSLVLLVAVVWIGQGVLSVLGQVDAYAKYWDDRPRAVPDFDRGDARRPLPGTFVADLPDFGGGPSLEDAMALSAIVREELLAHPDLVGVALEEATGASGWLDYAPDFFHPGDSGYVRWADAFWAQIEPRL